MKCTPFQVFSQSMNVRSAECLRWILSGLRYGGWSGLRCECPSHQVFWVAISLKDFLDTLRLRLPQAGCAAADLEYPVTHTSQYSGGCSLVMVRVKGDVSISVSQFSVDWYS